MTFTIWLLNDAGAKKVYTGRTREECVAVLQDVKAGLIPQLQQDGVFEIVKD